MASAGVQTRKVDPVPAPAVRFASPNNRAFALGFALIVATLALYLPAGGHPFVNLDDDGYIADNLYVKAGLRWETIKWAFTTYEQGNWHPLTWLAHELDCQLFQLNPAGHHYVNVLIHVLNVALLFLVLKRATGFLWRSLMVAALFALHPINVESVAWAAELKNLLSMSFFLLALGAYGWYSRKPLVSRYVVVALLFVLGLMAKPQVITFPFLLLLWDYWPLQRMDPGEEPSSGTKPDKRLPFKSLILEKLPLFALAAASAVITIKAQRSADAIRSLTRYPISARIANAIFSYAEYVRKAFWPSDLAPLYPHPGTSLRTWQVAAALLFLVAVTALVIKGRRHRYLVVGWLWFLGTLVPMIGLVQVGTQAMADRYAYLSLLGLFVMVCWGVADWAQQRKLAVAVPAGLGIAVLLALTAITHRQVGYWKDNVTLWSHTVEVTNPNYAAQDLLGGALLEQGKLEEAQPHFRTAAAINPTDPLSHVNLAFYEQQHGNFPQAIEDYRNVVGMTKDARLRANAFLNMGLAYRALGDLANAKRSFRSAVQLRPRMVRAWIGLGAAAQKSGDLDLAIEAYAHAVAMQPSDYGYILLAGALEQSGRGSDAQKAMEIARRLSQNFQQAQQLAESLSR